MIAGLNHVAIAVPDLEKAASQYRAMGAEVSDAQDLAEHGVTVVFVALPNTKIELLHPLGEDSPIAAFLEKNPSGGLHHICLDVGDIAGMTGIVAANGIRVLGDGRPKIGAHGKPVVFLHPKDTQGALLEFEQA